MRASGKGLILAMVLGSTPAHAQSARHFEPNETFTTADSQLLCELIAIQPALSEFGFAPFTSDLGEIERLDGLAQSLRWKNLPQQVSCGSESIRLQVERFGNSLISLGTSSDGQLAAFAGGYLYGPLNGRGGECIFRRVEGHWWLEGCVGTWAV